MCACYCVGGILDHKRVFAVCAVHVCEHVHVRMGICMLRNHNTVVIGFSMSTDITMSCQHHWGYQLILTCGFKVM